MKRALIGIAVAVVTYGALAFIDTTSAIQALIALPGACGLLLAIWELVKANAEHRYRLDESQAANAFILSATSHMAEVAFDKHVEFAETYVVKTNDGLGILFREGPTKQTLAIAAELYAIRRKYILWETSDVTTFLNKFEHALREIGANEHLLESVPVGERRTLLVEKLYDVFKKVVGLKELPTDSTSEIAVSHIIDQLREHLGITQLTKLRKHYLLEATKRMQSKVLG